MKKLFYSKTKDDFKIECFKDDSVDEITDNAYEIIGTNMTTGETVELTTNTPQGAIALADYTFASL